MKLAVIILMGMISVFHGAATAQAYPVKPIRLVIGSPPGAASDVIARLLADRYAKALGQPMVIEYKAGASGNIAAEQVARAAPDGYTILMTLDWHLSNAGVIAKMPFDPIGDFEPIGLFGTLPYLLAVGPSVPVKTFAELVALAKTRATPLSIGLPGPGSPPHLIIEQINSRMKMGVRPIQYKGTAPALTDVVAGHVDIVLGSASLIVPMANAGRVRVVATTASSRLEQFPDVPTLAEAGMPGYQGGTWFVLLAPAGTPAPIIARLNRELNAMMSDPETTAKLKVTGTMPLTGTSQHAQAFMKDELVRLLREMKAVGITPQ